MQRHAQTLSILLVLNCYKSENIRSTQHGSLTRLILHEKTVRRFIQKCGVLHPKLPSAAIAVSISFREDWSSTTISPQRPPENVRPRPAEALKTDLLKTTVAQHAAGVSTQQTNKQTKEMPVDKLLTYALVGRHFAKSSQCS